MSLYIYVSFVVLLIPPSTFLLHFPPDLRHIRTKSVLIESQVCFDPTGNLSKFAQISTKKFPSSKGTLKNLRNVCM